MQAACGLAQMDRLEDFIITRKKNFAYLKEHLIKFEDFMILPEATPKSDPSWFGFPITLHSDENIKRVELLTYFDQHKIGTRLLFAGNLTQQPYMMGQNYKVSGSLTQTNRLMNDSFWIGVYPGLTQEMLDFVIEKLGSYFSKI